MPRGLLRFYGSGDLHFVTCSCHQRRPLLGSPYRRDFFLDVLEETRLRYRLVVLGYVVMPEHFHLLMCEPQRGTPSTMMRVLKQRVARRFEESPFWQARFYDFNVWSEGKRREKLRYMHFNPVKRGLVSESEEWRWSSFRDYFCRTPGTVRINDCSMMELKLRRRSSSVG